MARSRACHGLVILSIKWCQVLPNPCMGRLSKHTRCVARTFEKGGGAAPTSPRVSIRLPVNY
jgi:hypothetical protein